MTEERRDSISRKIIHAEKFTVKGDFIINSAEEIAAELVDLLDKRELAKAANAGLERDIIIELARRIRPEVIGFEQAVKELEYAVDLALEVIAKGERGTDGPAFVDNVLKRLAEMTKVGDFDAGVKVVDDALAELDREDEQQRKNLRRSRDTLLKAGVEQDLLRRDPVAVARRFETIAALDATNEIPVLSDRYAASFYMFLSDGRDKGINLYLEVAIEIARRIVAATHSVNLRARALSALGNALVYLGQRESGTTRLEEAIIVYREALHELTRDRVPTDWASIQMNLGGALTTL